MMAILSPFSENRYEIARKTKLTIRSVMVMMVVRSAVLARSIRYADITACKMVRSFMIGVLHQRFFVPPWAPKVVVGKVENCG